MVKVTFTIVSLRHGPRRQRARTAALSVILVAGMSYEAPGTMMQFGFMTELTWGECLAIAARATSIVKGQAPV